MGRWRLDERGRADSERNSDRWRYGEREHTEGLVSEREKEERRKKKIGSKWKGRRKKRQREWERENKEAWRLCLLAQSAIIPSPLLPLTSPFGPASLYRAKTQVSILYTHTHTRTRTHKHTHPELLMSKLTYSFSPSLLFLPPPLLSQADMFILQSAHRGPNKHLVNESVLSVYNKVTGSHSGYGPLNNLS